MTRDILSDFLKQRAERLAVAKTERLELESKLSPFFINWSEMEMSLSDLLSAVLNIDAETSHVARAIYYKLTSFDARAQIVEAALTQLLAEEKGGRLAGVAEYASDVFLKIRSVKDARNTIAHGSVRTFTIKDKYHVRISAPVSDPHRVTPSLASGRAPGMSAHAIEVATNQTLWIICSLDGLSWIVRSYHDKGGSLKGMLPELLNDLRAIPYPS